MISDVPAETPDTTPDELPIVAIEVTPLDQVPPDVAFDNVVLPPTQAVPVPVIDAGRSLTVTTTDRAHPVESV